MARYYDPPSPQERPVVVNVKRDYDPVHWLATRGLTFLVVIGVLYALVR